MLPETIKAPYTLPRILQTLTIRTDDAFPDDLATVGGMLDVLRRPTWR